MVVMWCWCVWIWSSHCCSLRGAYVWICVGGVYGKIEGLEWMKFGI